MNLTEAEERNLEVRMLPVSATDLIKTVAGALRSIGREVIEFDHTIDAGFAGKFTVCCIVTVPRPGVIAPEMKKRKAGRVNAPVEK